jgi:serine/threonine-protein kinase
MGEEEEVTKQAEERVGTTLEDKWHLDKLLGVGGMASVYAATHRNQKRVAVKVLHRDLSLHPDVRARFLREGYLANTVGHSGVVTVDDDNVMEDGSAFLVMELLDGETLEARRAARGGTLPAGEVLGHAEKLLDVLVAAHDKGIVHRDLKPDNLFLTTSGELKVLDFGIARLQELSASSGGTRIGSILGTPTFMAPEQARARWDEVDGRTDIFAVGATLYTLLSGRFVHEAGTVNEELGLAMTARAGSLAAVAPGLPAPVVAFVDRALAFEKAARWPDARAMRSALAEVRATLPPGDRVDTQAEQEIAPTAARGSRTRAAVIAVVVAAVLAGGIVALRSRSDATGVPDASGRPAGTATTEPAAAAPAPSPAPATGSTVAAVEVTPAVATTPADTATTPARKDPGKPPPVATMKASAGASKPPATSTASIFDRRH